jgi:hypothetical protein
MIVEVPMPLCNSEKKIIETRALTAARTAGIPIPTGEVPGERPDFRFQTETGALGIEVSELVRPASSNGGIVPAAEATYHEQIVQMAQEQYYGAADANPAKVVLSFANVRGKKRDKREVARALAEFVKANVHRASPVTNFVGLELPEGFGSMSIAAESGDWWCGECGGVTLSEIGEVLASSISAKNKLLPTYRKDLAPGAQVWLLLYSTVAVSRSMPIPHGIEEWRFHFGFDRVFWFTCLENQFVEIQRAESYKQGLGGRVFSPSRQIASEIANCDPRQNPPSP